MFELKVIEKRIEGGINISNNDYYTTSQWNPMFIQNRDYYNEGSANYNIRPKVYLEFIAKSTKGLWGIKYTIEKYNESKDQYQRYKEFQLLLNLQNKDCKLRHVQN